MFQIETKQKLTNCVQQVIHQVRKSIEAVTSIPESYRAEGKSKPESRGPLYIVLTYCLPVIHAYTASLRLSFAFAVITSAIAFLLVVGVSLPRLSNRYEDEDEEE